MPLGRAGLNIRRSALLFGLLALVVAGSADAANAALKGRITGQEKLVPDVYVEAAKPESHRFTWREPSPAVDPKFRVLMANPSRDICLAAIANSPQTHGAIQIKVTGGRATPSTIAVPAGTKLSFENLDPFPHRLYQKEPGNAAWKAENISGGAHREWTAPSGSGKFEFRDESTPSLRFWVVVDPGVADVTFPGRDGAFVFTELQAGDYLLRAYFQGKPVSKAVSFSLKEKQTLELKEPLNVGEGSDAK